MERSNWTRRQFLQRSAAIGAGIALPFGALAQGGYPNKAVHMNVGFSAGGLTDVLARILVGPMGEKLGGTMIVENKTGAAGNLATEFVARSAPDGYNLLCSAVGQITVTPHTYTDMRINPLTDLVHVSMLGEGDLILTVSSQVPANTIAEFVALAKKKPGQMFFGDSGIGGNLHLYMEYFNMLAGLQMKGVHYRGTAQMIPDFLSNTVQMSLNAYPAIEGYITQGKLRPLMVVGKMREPKLPNVPTAAEAGFKPLEVCTNWFGIHAPKATPDAIVTRIHDALVESLKTDAVKAGLATNGIRAIGDTPAHFTARIASDYAVFGKVAKAANIKVE